MVNHTKLEGAKTIDKLMEDLYEHIEAMESLHEDLAESIECYTEESEEAMAEMQSYLDDAATYRDVNEMLCTELNAARGELLRLISCLEENGLVPAGDCCIHYGRLNPDYYVQDPEDPFYIENADKRFLELLHDQYLSLLRFEEQAPMTRTERKALLSHVIRESGLGAGSPEEWEAFLEGFRASTKMVR